MCVERLSLCDRWGTGEPHYREWDADKGLKLLRLGVETILWPVPCFLLNHIAVVGTQERNHAPLFF